MGIGDVHNKGGLISQQPVMNGIDNDWNTFIPLQILL